MKSAFTENTLLCCESKERTIVAFKEQVSQFPGMSGSREEWVGTEGQDWHVLSPAASSPSDLPGISLLPVLMSEAT